MSHPCCQKPGSEKSFICLHKVPLFLFLSCDLSETKTTEERGNTNGNILFTVHEKGKREKHAHDKENRKFARSEEHCAAFHTGFNVCQALAAARIPLMLSTAALCLLVREALHF